MSNFLNFVQDMQKIQEETVDVENKEGSDDLTGDSLEGSDSENITEMAVATGDGIRLKRIDTKSDDSPYKDYTMTGIHHVYVDGEHAGVVDKRSGKHYVLRPTVKGVMQPGSWRPLTPEEHANYIANPDTHGIHIYTNPSNGAVSRYSLDYDKTDTEFEHHNAHTHQFDNQQSAVDHLARAHRMTKEFGGDKAKQYLEAESVKDQYLKAKETSNKTRSTYEYLQRALSDAKSELPDDHALHAHIQNALGYPKLASTFDERNKLASRFRDLTYDLPEHHWSNTGMDIYKHLRRIDEPWKV